MRHKDVETWGYAANVLIIRAKIQLCERVALKPMLLCYQNTQPPRNQLKIHSYKRGILFCFCWSFITSLSTRLQFVKMNSLLCLYFHSFFISFKSQAKQLKVEAKETFILTLFHDKIISLRKCIIECRNWIC